MAKSGGSPGLSAVRVNDLQNGSSSGLRKSTKDIRRLICGNGHQGDGTCANLEEYCSQYGWCGTSAEHCGGSPPGPGPTPGGGTCGNGNMGNSICSNPGECCSQYGWCGTSAEHCGGSPPGPGPTPGGETCGNGNVGNGICSNPGECCSPFGWCGTSTEHCSAVRGTSAPYPSAPGTSAPFPTAPTVPTTSPSTGSSGGGPSAGGLSKTIVGYYAVSWSFIIYRAYCLCK